MPAKKKSIIKKSSHPPAAFSPALVEDVRQLIAEARHRVARAVDSGVVLLYWSIGNRIRRDILQEQRAEYGKQIVAALSRQLTAEFGSGYGEKNLRHMLRFAEVFPDLPIVSSLMRQLSWTHFFHLIYLGDPLQRDFYAEMCRIEGWNTRTLREKIDSMLFERTALSKRPAKLAELELKKLREENRITPDLVFRDPYILDFLGLKDTYAEKDLETAILREMESFILELGIGFAFVARQKAMTIDNEDHHLDLLFYHRHLRRLVVIDLKLGKFAPADVGQMEFYMRWLKKNEMRPGEKPPLGLILCAEKSDERIEVFELNTKGIRVAEYLTALPPKKLLEQKLHQAVELAQQRITQVPTQKKP